jgi:hypothetical protein
VWQTTSLGNADQGRICAIDVARLDTSFRIATRPRGKVLVHLERNDGKIRAKCNPYSCLRHMGSPYFVDKGWVTGCLLIHQLVVFCLYSHLLWGFWT